jgi:hypothetical protein
MGRALSASSRLIITNLQWSPEAKAFQQDRGFGRYGIHHPDSPMTGGSCDSPEGRRLSLPVAARQGRARAARTRWRTDGEADPCLPGMSGRSDRYCNHSPLRGCLYRNVREASIPNGLLCDEKPGKGASL